MKAYVDGSSLGMYGYILGKKTKIVKDHPMTNNQAEWMAVLTLLMDLEQSTAITIYSDSQIVVNQLKGEWETRNPMMKHMKEVCLQVIVVKQLKINIIWVPRKDNLCGKHLEKLLRRIRKKRKKLRSKRERGF